jgi:nucleoside-diphosphate-sugar epimerase
MMTESPSTIGSIYEKIWDLSPKFRDPEAYRTLQKLTKELIDIYDFDGRLDENPFASTAKRNLSLPTDELEHFLKNRTCLVTGGLGCVGSHLINKLLRLGVKKVILVDIKEYDSNLFIDKNRIIYIREDVCNQSGINQIFESHCPDIVYHIAAQRDPGLAETNVHDTVNVNVIGSLNIVQACEDSKSVKNCIFSSTGKASRYYTDEVYAATKKICEFIFDTYSRHSSIHYSMVRFTHILENSLMNINLREQTNDDHVYIHSPGKYVTAQNVKESANLLLNALLNTVAGQCNFLIVRHLEWPVESLEVALYYIKVSEKPLPIIFKGNPLGYTEKFFRGQMDWSNPQELNLLINVYEQKRKSYNKEGDIIISQIGATEQTVLDEALKNIKEAKDNATTRLVLFKELKKIVQASLLLVDKTYTVKILNWSLLPQYLKAEGSKVSDYGPTVILLSESLEGSPLHKEIEDLIIKKAVDGSLEKA